HKRMGEKRIVRQFQFEAWHRNDVPFVSAVIDLTYKIASWHENNKSPIVVHCCTGASRTGSFICINEFLGVVRQNLVGGAISVSKYALDLANSRPKLMDRVEHYKYIYYVLRQWLEAGGSTLFTLDTIQDAHNRLRKAPKSGNSSSRYQAELNVSCYPNNQSLDTPPNRMLPLETASHP
ncbi:hypothetical protein Ciccas_009343, partial [Cichlidogyrus casuarinus]